MGNETLKTVRRTEERRVRLPQSVASSLGVGGEVGAVALRKAMAAKLSKGDGDSVGAYQAAKAHLVSVGFEFTLDEIAAADK